MSMDKLEKYIKDNRDSFDDKIPSNNVWHKINDQLDNEAVPQVSMGGYLWRAAAIILFVTVIWLFVDRNNKENLTAQNRGSVEETQIPFKDVEAYYFKEIEQKQQLIIQYVKENPELNQNLLGVIDQLDSTYQVLKSRSEKGYGEKVIDAMVLNLQMRIDILNQQLNILEKIKRIKENETTSI